MRPSESSDRPAPRFDPDLGPAKRESKSVPATEPIIRTPRAYRVADILSELIIYFMVLFSPWAFGTTQTWSIWTMNTAAYILGALLLIKWCMRYATRFTPERWGILPSTPRSLATAEVEGVADPELSREKWWRFSTMALAIITGLLLVYCLVGVFNARATYYHAQMRFVYHDFIPWLPHSYDRTSSWFVFWQYLALAISFWAIRDWLLTKTREERFAALAAQPLLASGTGLAKLKPAGSFVLPARLQRLLWLLCINASLLGVEAILQRLDGTNKLLWLVEPARNRDADLQFGSYSYRSNAAQYFNLIWPVCVGFWWTLREHAVRASRKSRRIGQGPQILLLPCAILLAACPIISLARGGALITAANSLFAVVLLIYANRRGHPLLPVGAFILFTLSLALGGYLAWEKLQIRFQTMFEDKMSLRLEIYENAQQMTKDFPVLGSGPGTFASLYQLYRKNPEQHWNAYLHDDWLEARVTLGWIGFGLILAALAVLGLNAWRGGAIRMHWILPSMIGLGMSSCLVHAKYDFPFQVYSLFFLFVMLASILFCLRGTAR
jgi:hypothetical protein